MQHSSYKTLQPRPNTEERQMYVESKLYFFELYICSSSRFQIIAKIAKTTSLTEILLNCISRTSQTFSPTYIFKCFFRICQHWRHVKNWDRKFHAELFSNNKKNTSEKCCFRYEVAW